MSAPHVFFYVQYLEGIGHVVRAKRIVEALCAQGCPVTMVLGGLPIEGFTAGPATLHQLPPLSASPASYSTLLKADGTIADDAYKFARRELLAQIFDQAAPDVLVTEAFPMGRWALQFELEPLLAHAHAQAHAQAEAAGRPLILASLRDILQMPKRESKWRASVALFERYYDHMLVHGDPALVRIEESFPPLAHLLDRAHYTGLVAPDMAVDGADGDEPRETFDVIVSAGGGAIAHPVLSAAIEAKPHSVMAGASWLALAGPRMPELEYAALASAAADAGVRLERYRDGLAGLISRAQLSIQRAGYNTVADLSRTACRAVLVPDADDNQTEQPLRAAKLAALGRAVVVAEATLDAATMAAAIDQAMARQPETLALDLDGANAAAGIIRALWAAHQIAQDTTEPR